MHPKNLSIKDFTYYLPEDKIAFHPLAKRDDSKLLVYKNGAIKSDNYKNIAAHLPHGCTMVFNNTKVVEARLLFKKDSGGIIEIFCLEPNDIYPDITTAMQSTKSVQWRCLIGGASKWKNGTILTIPFQYQNNSYTLEAHYIEKKADCFVIELKWNNDLSFAEILHIAGHVPLPPYIKRADEIIDKNRYQTVFAKYDGSVAAPTAGLHFTDEVLQSLETKDILKSFVTLHVGAGTFKPVKTEKIDDHEMHAEYIEVAVPVIKQLLANENKNIIAVGTTSLRTIESLYWLGCKLVKNPEVFKNEMPFISQWEAYEIKDLPKVSIALKAILKYLQNNNNNKLLAKTQIIITPGYEFKIITGLITNFHQPASTLLLLIAAFIGNDWKKVYDYALTNNFRFLSYGDGSLLWRDEK